VEGMTGMDIKQNKNKNKNKNKNWLKQII